MKKNHLILFILLSFLSISVIFTSCKKDNPFDKEMEVLRAYVKDKGITTSPTSSGLYYIETKKGTGIQAVAGKKVTVSYEGRFLDGKVFNSSIAGQPVEFTLGVGKVIKGWDEGISYMKEGGKAQLIIPSNLAYGSNENYKIPAYTSLIFDVELISVQ